MTLQSLLDSLDAIRASWKSSLAGFIAGRTGGTGGAPAVPLSKKKNSLADFRARMELWALMRIAFSAARVALSKSGISKIAIRSFSGRIRLGRCGALLLMPAVVRQVPAAPTRCVRGTRWPLRLWRRGTDRLPRPTSQRCSRLWQGTWTWPGGQVCKWRGRHQPSDLRALQASSSPEVLPPSRPSPSLRVQHPLRHLR